MKIIFIRHADPYYPADTLTEKGWAEAERLAERVASWDVKRFYSSPFGRARDTASVSMKKLGRSAEVKNWLHEFLPRHELVAGEKETFCFELPLALLREDPRHFDYKRWTETELMKSGAVGESAFEVFAGLDEITAENGYRRDGLGYAVERRNDDTLVCFCHWGSMLLCVAHLLGVSPHLIWKVSDVPPSGVTILHTEEQNGRADFVCDCIGDISHLDE